jgi:micrococcal nuclease
MRKVLVAAVAALAFALAACDGSGSQSASPAFDDAGAARRVGTNVVRVVDGDTIVVTGKIRVRLIGMDTPEVVDPRKPVQCFGRAASARTKHLLPPGTPVRLVYDVDRYDRYGRTLAYVYRARDNLFVNAALVREGYATVYTFPPNVAHEEDFVRLEREARAADRGLWSAC